MTTRLLVLPVLLAPLCLALGCTAPTELPQPEEARADDKPKAEPLPQAPPPRVKKTTAELLVGKWRMVTDDDGQPLPLLSPVYVEFTKDGRFSIVIEDPRNTARDQSGTGTYQLKHQAIKFTEEPSKTRPGKTWEVKIETITDTELWFSRSGKKPPKCSRLVRCEMK